jgi:pyridoxine 4-dehydrogenase
MTESGSNGAGILELGDLTVKRLGFGAMRLCGPGIWGEPENQQAAEDVLRRVVEVGINLIDTADAYGPGVNEDQISSALYPYPEDLVIATKGGLVRPGPGRWQTNGRPQHLREACEGSLRRLKVDTIDVYQLHRPDSRVPFEDSVWALAELRDEGKIRHVGLSNVGVRELVMALDIVPIVSVQNRYNLTDRSSEAVIETCEREGIAFIPWFPLATGELAGEGSPVAKIAAEKGVSPSQLALAWLLHRSPVILPIPGTSSVAHLEDNVAAAGVSLPDDEMAALTAAAG